MLKEYFTFSKGERNAAIILVVITTVVFIGVRGYFYANPVQNAFSVGDSAKVDSFVAAYKQYTEGAEPALFDFDPNQIGIAEWQQLGFSEKQAKAIETYKTKRKFSKPDDLKKVYVISEEMYARLLPYIQIGGVQPEDMEEAFQEKNVQVEINAADSAAFVRVDGIGPYYARKIIKYRNELGGFVYVEQIKEVWGMPDSVYQKVKAQMTCVPKVRRKINVNKDDLEVMRAHPYIRTALGRILIKRRTKYGEFQSVEDLRRIVQIDDSLYQKLEPYVTVE